jgi:hypothetical protein
LVINLKTAKALGVKSESLGSFEMSDNNKSSLR